MKIRLENVWQPNFHRVSIVFCLRKECNRAKSSVESWKCTWFDVGDWTLVHEVPAEAPH